MVIIYSKVFLSFFKRSVCSWTQLGVHCAPLQGPQIRARMQPEAVEPPQQVESALVTHAEALEAEGSWSKAIDAYLSITQQHISDQDRQIEATFLHLISESLLCTLVKFITSRFVVGQTTGVAAKGLYK